MYSVNVRKFVRTKSVNSKKPYRCSERTRYATESASQIAEAAIDVLRQAGKGSRFSGLEEFGDAHEFWNEGHECPEGDPSDECEQLELESCREWIEKRIGDLRQEESEELHLSFPDSFIQFTVLCK